MRTKTNKPAAHLKSSTNMPKPGIVAIAARLKISPSTVSRALREETAHLVTPERRKQIMDLIGQHDFAINPGARMLRRGINTTLAVVMPSDDNIFGSEFYGRMLAGVLHAATVRNWHVQIRLFDKTSSTDVRETLQRISMDVAGLIYMAAPLSSSEVEQLNGYRRPLIIVKSALQQEMKIDDTPVRVVGVNNIEGAKTAINFLMQLGHKRIGLLLGQPDSRDACERKEGYLAAMREAGIAPRSEWIITGEFNIESGRTGMEKLLKGKTLPTALCCANDEIAFGAISILQANGKRCPDDMSIVGFDDGFWATACRPALTTMRQPLADIAERAVGAVVDATYARKSVAARTDFNLPTSLVIRESTRFNTAA